MGIFYRYFLLIFVALSILSCLQNHETNNLRKSEYECKNTHQDFLLSKWQYKYLYSDFNNHNCKLRNFNRYYNISTKDFEPQKFLATFEKYKKIHTMYHPIDRDEKLYSEMEMFFYENSSSYKEYAQISAFITGSGNAFYTYAVGENLAQMFMIFPNKFSEMYRYTTLLDIDYQYEIWSYISLLCSLQLYYRVSPIYNDKEFKNLPKDTSINIYKDMYPFLYNTFGSLPWKLTIMDQEAQYCYSDTTYISYLNHLETQFERSMIDSITHHMNRAIKNMAIGVKEDIAK